MPSSTKKRTAPRSAKLKSGTKVIPAKSAPGRKFSAAATSIRRPAKSNVPTTERSGSKLAMVLGMLREPADTTIAGVRQVNRIISLAFLAPDLVQAAVDGRLPRGIGVETLRSCPTDWHQQRIALGLAS